MATTPDRFEVRVCDHCRLGFIWPEPTNELLARSYPDAYFGGKSARVTLRSRLRKPLQALTLVREFGYPADVLTPRRLNAIPVLSALLSRFWRRHEARMPRWVEGGRLLDVGCGTGDFLAQMRDIGWSVLGVEPARAAVEQAQRQGVPVVEGELVDVGLSPDAFDAVRMSGVLEHVRDPWAVLTEVHRVLRPGGEVIVNLQNIRSWNARLLRGYWHHLDTPRHLTHFEPRSLGDALRQLGFEQIRFDFCSGYEGTWYSLLAAAGDLAFGGTRRKPLHQTMLARVGRALKYFAIPSLSLWASLTDTARRGELFTMRAVKPSARVEDGRSPTA